MYNVLCKRQLETNGLLNHLSCVNFMESKIENLQTGLN